MTILTIVLTHNSPNQLALFLERLRDKSPESLDRSRFLVLNQSDLLIAELEYASICKKHGIRQVGRRNRGASGGRFVAAELFHESNADAMFYFEDDMLMWDGPDMRCRFGFPNHVRGLFDKAIRVLQFEALDFLKLSFHEVYADHSRNFYDGTPARFDKLGSVDNEIGYFIGQVYYSNWPMLIS